MVWVSRVETGGDGSPPPEFALLLERCPSGEAVLALAGELDLYRVPEIKEALAEAIGPKPPDGGLPRERGQMPAVRRIAVDLRSVTFIDSTTLALLLAASRRQRARGGELLVLVGSQTPMTAFEVTGFDRLLTIRNADEASNEGEPSASTRRSASALARTRNGGRESSDGTGSW